VDETTKVGKKQRVNPQNPPRIIRGRKQKKGLPMTSNLATSIGDTELGTTR
jgi:hypothetical protein